MSKQIRQENREKPKILVVASAAQYEKSKFDTFIEAVAWNNVLHVKLTGERTSML